MILKDLINYKGGIINIKIERRIILKIFIILLLGNNKAVLGML